MRALILVGGAVVAALHMGCSSGSTAPSGPPATFTQIYPLIFPIQTRAQCNFCHGLPANMTTNGKFSVGADKASAYAALVGPSSSSVKCGGAVYVVPGQPDESLLLSKVTTPSCGSLMPLGGDPLTDGEVEMIRSWIAAGAKDD